MSNLYIMVGVPGSGKSTWCKNNIQLSDAYISRDKIRFSLIKENEEYFSKENQVFNEFIRQINLSLSNGKNVYADATHLNEVSRAKLINRIQNADKIIAIYIKISLETALKRNSQRIGRANVPEKIIINMFNETLTEPTTKEKGIDQVIIINNE